MNYHQLYIKNAIESPIGFRKHQKRGLLIAFWVVLIAVVLKVVTTDAPFESMVSALLIALMALLPSYLWCSDRAKGLPLFPIMCLMYISSHAFPLISKNPKVLIYPESLHFYAALIVATFLGVGTITWLAFVKQEPRRLSKIKVFKPNQVKPFFLQILFISLLFDFLQNTGYLGLFVPSSFYFILKTAMPALTNLGLMILGYQLGAKNLSRLEARLFIFLSSLLVFQAGVSLYLSTGGLYVVLTSLGWMFGSGKLPWRLLLITFLIISFLNVGKGQTRATYWRQGSIQPQAYITIYSDWINNSLNKIKKPSDIFGSEKEGSLSDRSTLIDMLLKAISDTGTVRPYLYGKTYAIIPQLLVPRIFNTNKIRGSEATHILSIHYGLQTYKETLTTEIAWGLLQEAYANFGWLGSAGIGVFLGSLYGWITRWTMKVPVTSYRFLISLIFLMLALKNEFTLGSFVTVVVQSTMILFVIRSLLMKIITYYPYNLSTYPNSINRNTQY